MHRQPGRNHPYLWKMQQREGRLDQGNMPGMRRIEATTEDSDRALIQCLLPNLAVPEHDPFLGGQPLKTHRPAHVQAIGGDADLRP